ncbi:MAG: exodeoxyribonuclease VII small subunit [Candidatus Aminicenantes bacterium]|nr:exodeoxyribonuclease VII small subunit [Candidatus Aminicenantes bacterium]
MTEKSFEKALVELEGIVEKMEGAGLSLNESLALFEKGVKLAHFLRRELDKAEKKIEILLKDNKGEMKREAFSLSEEKEAASEEAEEPDSEEDQGLPF